MSQASTATMSKVRTDEDTIILLVGEQLDEQRRHAVARAERPQVDMFPIEAQTEGAIRDFSWLRARAASEPLTGLMVWLAERIGFWHFWLALRVLFTLRQTTVIYATGEDVGIAIAILLRLTRQARPQVIMRLEEPIYGRTPLRRTMIKTLVHFGLKRVVLILARSHAMIRRIEQEFGIPRERVQFVPEAVDMTFFDPNLPPVASDLVNLPSGPYLLGAGLELRDYPTLIEAVRDLPIQVIIAAGSPWSRRNFGLGADQCPANTTVASFSALQMRELYRHATLVVVPVVPTTRSCGISVGLEAMAMGRPLLATATAGLQSYLEDGVTAALVPPGDPVAMRARIQTLLAKPAATTAMALRAQQQVRAKFALDRFIQTCVVLIKARSRPLQ